MVYKKSRGEQLFDIINHLIMIFIFIVMVYPFLYVLNYSLSIPGRIRNPLLIVPAGINLEAYKIAFSDPSIYHAFFVSVARSTIGPLTMLIVTAMAGHALSYKELIAGRFFRLFFLFTMYFSAGIIPVYLLFKTLRLTGTFWVYIVPGMVNVFNLILIKTYIETIPRSLEESVLIDGGNEFDAFWKVIFPLCLPVNAAVVLFSCVGHWNSYIDTQLYAAMNQELHTMQYVLYNVLAVQMQQSLEEAKRRYTETVVTSESLKMAITVITVIPIACVYPFLQRYFVSGLLIGSIKA